MENNNQEFKDLIEEFEIIPESMTRMSNNTLIRAKKRQRKKLVTTPTATILAFLLTLTFAVNISPTVAYALERIPIIGQIAAAVNFNPSLQGAIDNDFIQYIGLEHTLDGITMRVEYVIVDQQQINIFYTLASDTFDYIRDWSPVIRDSNGDSISSSLSFGGMSGNHEIRQLVVDFHRNQVPSDIRLQLEVLPLYSNPNIPFLVGEEPYDWHSTPENLITFAFNLSFDPNFTERGVTLELSSGFEVDGQYMILESVNILPTQLRANFAADEENNAWLIALDFHLIDERGHRFESITNGISAMSSSNSPMMTTHILHSPYFANYENLSLVIEELIWLDKSLARTRVDLITGAYSHLPAGVSVDQIRRENNGVYLRFAVDANSSGHSQQIFGWNFFNEDGVEFAIESMSSFGDYVEFFLADFDENVVYLMNRFTHVSALGEPIILEIR